ncbi:MAG: YbjQ family protein [Spirochaetaceae bacterium]
MNKVGLTLIKFFRLLGSLGFIGGIFVLFFVGMPWYIYQDETLPPWLKVAIYCFLGGLFLVLITVAAEQGGKKSEAEVLTFDETERKVSIQNSSEIPGKEIEKNLGLVKGHTIYAIWIGKDLSSMIRLILGGELLEYTDMMGKARKLATKRMIDEAEELGADAIINVRFMTTSVIGSAAELLAYGTAVKLK